MSEKSEDVAVTQKEIVLETYFKFLSEFAYEKAKDILEKEMSVTPHSIWFTLVQVLVGLTAADKDYMNLTFVNAHQGTKLFGKRDSKLMKNILMVLLSDLQKIQHCIEIGGKVPILESAPPPPGFEKTAVMDSKPSTDLMHVISCQLQNFVSARMATSTFLEQLYLTGTNKRLIYDEHLRTLKEILNKSQNEFHHPLIIPVENNFLWECEILVHLLEAQLNMQSFNYLATMMALYKVHTKLGYFTGGVSTREVKSSFFGRSSKTSAVPALLTWISKFKSALLCKVALYFHNALSTHQLVPADFKTAISKCKVDLVGKIQQFHKKSDALCTCLVYACAGTSYRGIGYHFPIELPDSVGVQRSGLESFPAIFSYPSLKAEKHWPGIISILTSKFKQMEAADKPQYFYDDKINSTYFLSCVDRGVTLVIIFECRKSERDSSIQHYIAEMGSYLTFSKIWSSLGSF